MTIEQLDNIKQKVQQQNTMSLDDLFSSIFDASTGGQPIAFADNFEIDLEDDAEEKILNELYVTYPQLEKNLIHQTYNQLDKDKDKTIDQLDSMMKDFQ